MKPVKKSEKQIFKTAGSVWSDRTGKYKSDSCFQIEKDFSFLKFEFFSEGKPLYFHVSDPLGIVRVQMLSKQNVKQTVLHEDESQSGIGTVFGKIRKGEWCITAFAFGARCSMTQGKTSYEVRVSSGVYDERVTEDYQEDESADNVYISWLDENWSGKGPFVLKNFESDDKTENSVIDLKSSLYSVFPPVDSAIDETEDSPDYSASTGENPSKRSGRTCRWLRGDFHVHSFLSDGSASPLQLLDEGISENLDFFFISEHGILTPSFPGKKGINVFPSYEVTTEAGHMNLHGLRSLPYGIHDKGPHPDWKYLEKILTEARKRGALVSVNHPMLHPWEWLYKSIPLSMIDAVEVITDPYAADDGAPEANEKALKLLSMMWDSGFRITGIGGSDTHTEYSDSQLGQPVTSVYACPGSMKSVLDGIRNHHAAVFTDSDCRLEYRINGKIILPGTDIDRSSGFCSAEGFMTGIEDTSSGTENNLKEVFLSGAENSGCTESGDIDLEILFDPGKEKNAYTIRIISGSTAVEETRTEQGAKILLKIKWKSTSAWIRCEVRDSSGMLRCFINPVYRGNHPVFRSKYNVREDGNRIETWGDLVEKM